MGGYEGYNDCGASQWVALGSLLGTPLEANTEIHLLYPTHLPGGRDERAGGRSCKSGRT